MIEPVVPSTVAYGQMHQ